MANIPDKRQIVNSPKRCTDTPQVGDIQKNASLNQGLKRVTAHTECSRTASCQAFDAYPHIERENLRNTHLVPSRQGDDNGHTNPTSIVRGSVHTSQDNDDAHQLYASPRNILPMHDKYASHEQGYIQ